MCGARSAYPGIRQHLIGTLERQTRDWGLDGLKLDFVDLWVPPAMEYPGVSPAGRDMADVPEAADHLLTQIMQRLRTIRPEVMIEFRQWYIGPLMRKYGNMLRAADCPDCAASNRMRTIDIRLLSGNTPAHSDMLEWHAGNRVEVATMQLLHAMFSVPQISVLLDAIPQEHVEMLRFWLGFWRENRDVLLDGRLEPLMPQWLYPVIRSSTADKRCCRVRGYGGGDWRGSAAEADADQRDIDAAASCWTCQETMARGGCERTPRRESVSAIRYASDGRCASR